MTDFLRKAELESIVLFKFFEEANGTGHPKAIHDLPKLFSAVIPQHRLKLAVEELYSTDMVSYNHVGQWQMYYITNKGLLRIEALLTTPGSFLNAYLQHGDEWALSRVSKAIPASDRIVTVGHNEPPASEVIAELAAIEEALATSNEVGAQFGDDREVALAELGALQKILSAGAVRSGTLLASARRTLSWITEKGAGTVVAEMAKIALKHILGWLS